MTKGKILVVDDEALVRRTMQDILEGDGYEVSSAEAAGSALHAVQEERFDLVLTDIRMPGLSGVELARQLGELSPETVCVLVTGYASIETARQAIQEGAYDYVLKPFDKNGLRMSVANALERKRLRDENARLRQLVELYGISQAMATGVEPAELQESVLKTAVRGTRSACGAILIFDMSVKGIIAGATTGRGEFAVQLANCLLQEGVDSCLERMRMGPSLVACSGDDRAHPLSGRIYRWSPRNGLSLCGPQSAETLLMPVEAGGEIAGVLAVSKDAGQGPFIQGDLNLLAILCTQLGMAVRSRQLFSEVEDSCLHSLFTIATIVDDMSPQTRGHMERVARLSRQLGNKVGLGDQELEALHTGARLHDIGKLGVRQPASAEDEGLLLPQQNGGDNHPVIGDRILAPFLFLAEARRMVRHHHERHDGQGFPDGLTGKDMTPALHIVQVVNFYDNLISAYPNLSPSETVARLGEGKGSRFDPAITDRFIGLIGEAGGLYPG